MYPDDKQDPKTQRKKKRTMQRKNCRGRVDIDTWALESRVDLYTDGVRRRVTV
jgi:hypothetical protein